VMACKNVVKMTSIEVQRCGVNSGQDSLRNWKPIK